MFINNITFLSFAINIYLKQQYNLKNHPIMALEDTDLQGNID